MAIGKKFNSLIFSLFLVACSPDYPLGFHSTDEDVMRQFIAQLDKERISYVLGKDGTVFYKADDESTVKEIYEMLQIKQVPNTTVKYEEPEMREYLKSILQSKGFEFQEEEREDGVWIRWYPETDVQRDEIHTEVFNYAFDLQAQQKCRGLAVAKSLKRDNCAEASSQEN